MTDTRKDSASPDPRAEDGSSRRKLLAGAGAAAVAMAFAGVGRASSKNVDIVLQTMEECPDLVLDINTAFTKLFYEAQVELSSEEKKELFEELGALIVDHYPQIHVKV